MISVLFLALTISCSSTKQELVVTDDVQKIFSLIGQNNQIHYKTIVEDLGNPIGYYIKSHLLHFDLCVDGSKPSLITEKEIVFLKTSFDAQKTIRLDKLRLKIKNLIHKKGNGKTSFISAPVIFRNNTMAVYYSFSRYGGGFKLLQKKRDTWQQMCSNTVWIE
jgi:hypothetical protein